MSVGFGQLLVIVLMVILLFGNFKKFMKDFSAGGVTAINTFKEGLKEAESDKLEAKKDPEMKDSKDSGQPKV
jgi:Sec-independent protein translocase protein TatA